MAYYSQAPRTAGAGQGLSSFSQPSPPFAADQAAYYQPSPYNQYGATPRLGKGLGAAAPGNRSNIGIMLASLVLPWVIFGLTFSMMSFYFHYRYPRNTQLFLVALFLFVAGLAAASVSAARSGAGGKHGSAWSMVLAGSVLMAFFLGLLAGDWNYMEHMSKFYDVLNLNTYENINPASTVGHQLMDGGRITFVEGSHLDVNKAIGFKNLAVYCVAPIVNSAADAPSTGSFDFWAVGKDCCTGEIGDFGSCGATDDPNVHAALRLMDDELRPYFRLAVQQAEATFNIKATHPMFYTWLSSPDTEMVRYEEQGYKSFIIGLFMFFAFQALVVGFAAVAISRT